MFGMSSKYQPVGDDEKFQESFPRRSSTSTSDSTLLEDEEDSRRTSQPRTSFGPKWMWLAHTALLSLSFTMFVSAFFTKASTLQHVKQFSAYCEYLRHFNYYPLIFEQRRQRKQSNTTKSNSITQWGRGRLMSDPVLK